MSKQRPKSKKKATTAPTVGLVRTTFITSQSGSANEGYVVSVRSQFGRTIDLLLSPLEFFEATRRHAFFLKGNVEAA